MSFQLWSPFKYTLPSTLLPLTLRRFDFDLPLSVHSLLLYSLPFCISSTMSPFEYTLPSTLLPSTLHSLRLCALVCIETHIQIHIERHPYMYRPMPTKTYTYTHYACLFSYVDKHPCTPTYKHMHTHHLYNHCHSHSQMETPKYLTVFTK